jgi:hypothetical protein
MSIVYVAVGSSGLRADVDKRRLAESNGVRHVEPRISLVLGIG